MTLQAYHPALMRFYMINDKWQYLFSLAPFWLQVEVTVFVNLFSLFLSPEQVVFVVDN